MNLPIATAFLVALLQATPQPLPPPVVEPAVSLWGVLGWAVFNPAVIGVAVAIGRRADQTAKLGIAAFVSALAGIALLWLAARVGLGLAVDTARSAVGVFIVSLPLGVLWAWIGRRIAPSA